MLPISPLQQNSILSSLKINLSRGSHSYSWCQKFTCNTLLPPWNSDSVYEIVPCSSRTESSDPQYPHPYLNAYLKRFILYFFAHNVKSNQVLFFYNNFHLIQNKLQLFPLVHATIGLDLDLLHDFCRLVNILLRFLPFHHH